LNPSEHSRVSKRLHRVVRVIVEPEAKKVRCQGSRIPVLVSVVDDDGGKVVEFHFCVEQTDIPPGSVLWREILANEAMVKFDRQETKPSADGKGVA